MTQLPLHLTDIRIVEHQLPSVHAAVQLGIKRMGLVGLAARTGVVWSTIAGVGMNCPVERDKLRTLEEGLLRLGLLDGDEFDAAAKERVA